MKKLYIDLCVYNRPFDSQKQTRISLETFLFLFVLEEVEKGRYKTVNSAVLEYENRNNPYAERRGRIADFLALAAEWVGLTDDVTRRGAQLERMGFGPLDALHLACAEKAKADCLITCDDELVTRAKKHEKILKIAALSLVEFAQKEARTWQK